MAPLEEDMKREMKKTHAPLVVQTQRKKGSTIKLHVT